ncbi:Signal transduction histidine kinase regulating C4-dicarboxylate transport system [Hahella chejuensis KCTC 2396]|uniref:histidine kinase n=1 Tax=Hahella chejuensis (strain KCTC 2396) TaxID=349521 RepID=Q2SQC9_HAHCH|nr:ATP-binding protein [Hahella chejuensis]ABC27145.1 Signal transduction histidine kinase regulating C4-dicarboxylate transport system [Hahella chejuensis KCTC 2396]
MNDIDPEFTLADLLTAKDIESLQNRLSPLLETSVSIVPAQDKPDADAWPIRYQIRAVAYLVASAPKEKAEAACKLVEAILHQAARYRLAASLHHHVVEQDYEELQRKHQALQESEARYRELAEQLERRVEEQVAQIELRRKQVYEAEKLSALGQLGAGVAHEINNPLGFIQSNLNSGKGYLQDISDALTEMSRGHDVKAIFSRYELDFVIKDLHILMSDTLDGVARVAKIVKDLKGFAGTDGGSRQKVAMEELMESVCNLAKPLMGGHIHLRKEYEPTPSVWVDYSAFCQAVYAIMLNAVQAIGERGEVLVQCGPGASGVRIVIEDTGCGMDAETLNRIFEPFFTTKPVGSGTGLGMTLCRDIIRAHGGEIHVASEPGKGSRFCIELPMTEEAPG